MQNVDPPTNLCVADVEIFYSYADLPLKASKSDPFRKGVTIQLHISNPNICPLSIISASTSAGSVNIQDHLITTLGRWSSDSYCHYIRTSKEAIQKAQKALTLSK